MTSDIAVIYPTIMEMAGVDYSDFKADGTTDGESLVSLFSDLENRKEGYPRSDFYHFYGKLGYGGFHNFATWALNCNDDLLRSPQTWTVETKVSKAANAPAYLNSGLVSRHRLRTTC